MKIGLLGGSFNPPHLGHLHISIEARKRLKLQQIWWLPNKQNPLKKIQNSDFDQRFEKCQELVKSNPFIKIKDFEKNLKSNYSFDLISKIIQNYPQHQFFWILGADNLPQFHKWKNWQKIIGLTPLIILDRENFFYSAIKSPANLYSQKLTNSQKSPKIHLLKIKTSPFSSTKIRKSNSRKSKS